MKDWQQTPLFAELWRFFKFGVTGFMNTAVDFVVFLVLSYLGVGQYVAQVISYSCGMLNSYVINRLWTFRGCGKRMFGAELPRFVAVNLCLLLLSLGVLWLVQGQWGYPKLLAKLCATAITMVLGFVLNRLWVFGGGRQR